ncbi:MAG: sugar transferase [Elusimicrobiales bacterium]|nr:sugar transferase [Elusimicrobiales bacterium]
MKRFFDVLMFLAALAVAGLPMAFIALLVRITSRGPALYWSDRVGRDNKIFRMPKFRTMLTDTPQLPTHQMKEPEKYLIPGGGFLRRYSLDELPQLFSILKGDMSFVGPRPALFNQDDLVALRTSKGIHHLVPGLTGWAQINGRDELPIPVKVDYDEYYLKNRSFLLDLKILSLTLISALSARGVHH